MFMHINTTSSLRTKLSTGARQLPRRLLFLFLLAVACAPQCPAQATDEYHKVEAYGGYSLARVKSNVESFSFSSASAGSGTFTNLCSAATGDMIGTNSQKRS